jgi:hypothetical protein
VQVLRFRATHLTLGAGGAAAGAEAGAEAEAGAGVGAGAGAGAGVGAGAGAFADLPGPFADLPAPLALRARTKLADTAFAGLGPVALRRGAVALRGFFKARLALGAPAARCGLAGRAPLGDRAARGLPAARGLRPGLAAGAAAAAAPGLFPMTVLYCSGRIRVHGAVGLFCPAERR